MMHWRPLWLLGVRTGESDPVESARDRSEFSITILWSRDVRNATSPDHGKPINWHDFTPTSDTGYAWSLSTAWSSCNVEFPLKENTGQYAVLQEINLKYWTSFISPVIKLCKCFYKPSCTKIARFTDYNSWFYCTHMHLLINTNQLCITKVFMAQLMAHNSINFKAYREVKMAKIRLNSAITFVLIELPVLFVLIYECVYVLAFSLI